MITHYASSNGRLTPIAEMADPHLDNAIGKLIRTGGDMPMLQALKAEQSSRIQAGAEAASQLGRFSR